MVFTVDPRVDSSGFEGERRGKDGGGVNGRGGGISVSVFGFLWPGEALFSDIVRLIVPLEDERLASRVSLACTLTPPPVKFGTDL